MIAFSCSGCRKRFEVKDEFGGRKTKCPQCGTALVVPNSTLAVPPEPAPRLETTSSPCSNCRTPLQAGARFCSSCGAPTSRKEGVPLFPCPACGRNVSSQAESCPGCGQPGFEYCSQRVTENSLGGSTGQKAFKDLLRKGWEVVDENWEEEEFGGRNNDDERVEITIYKLRRSLLKSR